MSDTGDGSEPGVLIVEDDPDVREALVEVLADHAFHPIAAANGREALDRLQAGARPCVILLDLMMPVMDGWQFRAEQRRDPSLCRIPVVLLTAHNNAREAAAQMQADGYLKKPVQLATLIAAVRRFCDPESSSG